MIRKYLTLLSIAVLILSNSSGTFAQTVIPRFLSGHSFEIGIEQHGKPVIIENHQVTLRKAPFTLLFYFLQPEGILINASATPESYDPARTGAPFEDIPGFSDLGMAEEAFNPKVILMLSSQAPHFWYYAHDAEHRFNEIDKQNGMLVCRRIVANVMHRDTTKEITPIQDLVENTLYLVFMKTEWTKDFRHQIEKQREYLKITFE